ncbi:MAG: hypothetical protein ACI9E5_001223, partial [Candidatus Omnitrophota bacterium]
SIIFPSGVTFINEATGLVELQLNIADTQ